MGSAKPPHTSGFLLLVVCGTMVLIHPLCITSTLHHGFFLPKESVHSVVSHFLKTAKKNPLYKTGALNRGESLIKVKRSK